jgi:hypothetical protein
MIEAPVDLSDREVWPQAAGKRRLLVEAENPDRTLDELRDVLATSGGLYERGIAVRLAADPTDGSVAIHPLTPQAVVHLAHRCCRPYRLNRDKAGAVTEVDIQLPLSCARAYLDLHGERGLPPLNGLCPAPLLRGDGAIHTRPGYDHETGLWLEAVPDIAARVPRRPSKADAESALHTIRDAFATFCFADALTRRVPDSAVPLVDLEQPPGLDESSLLNAVLTAVCRPSLDLAPGVLIRAAALSGAGTGKGLLARCMCLIAFGREPHAVTSGGSVQELEKRLAAELMGGSPVLFLDNLNNVVLRSDLLASGLTERPARVRMLGHSRMVTLNASALTLITGNGLSVSEDLTRRFITIGLDARTENPEAREFATDVRAEVMRRRPELLAALLTIWRRGVVEQNLPAGKPLGGFEQWCRWVRDPLLTLGCRDPVERVGEAKQRDSERQAFVELFELWWARHRDKPVKVAELHEEVKSILDPHRRGRQYLASKVATLAGTRHAGFLVERQSAAGRWGASTYVLRRTDEQASDRA